jgi:hypothetical protein
MLRNIALACGGSRHGLPLLENNLATSFPPIGISLGTAETDPMINLAAIHLENHHRTEPSGKLHVRD